MRWFDRSKVESQHQYIFKSSDDAGYERDCHAMEVSVKETPLFVILQARVWAIWIELKLLLPFLQLQLI